MLGVSQTGVVSGPSRGNVRCAAVAEADRPALRRGDAGLADDPAIQLGSGLARWEVGLRLRYEIVKEVAPFIGVSFEQFTGTTANLVAAQGGPTSNLRALVGLKVWF